MIAERLSELRQRIKNACNDAGRPEGTVRLLAVSKGQPVEKIIEAYDLGLRDFGENYAVELSKKIEQLKGSCPDISWHYVGQIQSNKLRLIGEASWVHTLSDFRHAEALSRFEMPQLGRRTLMQVNLGEEKHRGGVPPSDVNELYAEIKTLPGLNLCGLMTIAPVSQNVSPSVWFKRLVEIKSSLEQSIGLTVPELSMGMSTDFEDAIGYGATWIRIGTLLFGERR